MDFLNKSRISSRTFSLVKILGAGGGEDRGDAAEQQEEEDGEDKRLCELDKLSRQTHRKQFL